MKLRQTEWMVIKQKRKEEKRKTQPEGEATQPSLSRQILIGRERLDFNRVGRRFLNPLLAASLLALSMHWNSSSGIFLHLISSLALQHCATLYRTVMLSAAATTPSSIITIASS